MEASPVAPGVALKGAKVEVAGGTMAVAVARVAVLGLG